VRYRENRHMWFNIVCVVVTIVYLIPVRFLMPSMDDYIYADQIIRGPMAGDHSALSSVFMSVGNVYLTWQGNYFSFFILFLYAAIGGLAISWVRFTIAVNIVLLFFSIFFLLCSILRNGENLRHTDLYLIMTLLLLVFCGLNRASPSEALYWLNASVIYTMPLALSLFSLGNAIRYRDSHSAKNLIISCILAACAAGGVLMITAFLNAALLCLILNDWLTNKKINRGILADFMMAMAGGLVNALAPGNFVRAQKNDLSSNRIAAAFKNTLLVFEERVSFSLRKEYLLCGCIALFLLMLFSVRQDNRKEKMVRPVVLWIEGLFILFATIYPVIFGYNSTAIQPWRFCFVIEFLIALVFLGCSGYSAYYIANRWNIRGNKIQKGIAVFFIVLLFFMNYQYAGKENMMLLTMGREFKNGQLEAFFDQENRMINDIVHSQSEDVVIDIGNPSSGILKDFNLKEDPDDYVNISMAQYYGKNTVRIVPNK